MIKKALLPLWIAAGVGLFLYSFTQVDLSLTLSQSSIFQTVQKWFQYVGWFNRPLSAALYLVIFAAMFVLYFITLNLIRQKKIEWRMVSKIVISLSVILFFSYTAFSYDIFNYIFDSKILVHYHQNPYFHKALDFPGDPMLSFMHWTHRTYPYGPAWLVITAPTYFIGFGIFSLTFYLFKLITVAAFVWSAFLIKKISDKLDINSTLVVAAFALNPLVISETLVSAHNDIFMIAFALFSLSLFLEKKYLFSAFSLIFSIAIKYATLLLIPAFLARKFLKLTNERFLQIMLVTMVAAVILATVRTNFQPWYLLYTLPFAAFLQEKKYVAIPVILISVAGVLQYVPYLYLGNWDPPVPATINGIMITSVVLSIAAVLLSKLSKIRL